MEDQVRANMAFFNDAMRVWSPFVPKPGEEPAKAVEPGANANSGELDALKKQMAEMQEKLESLAKK
jgi:polyhydroxyalkanoate synthesis regulator protein